MFPWIISLTFASAFGTTMLAAGTRIGRQRALAALVQLLERGSFRLVSGEGRPVSVSELSRELDSGAGAAAAASSPKALLALALITACFGALLAFLLVRAVG